MLFDGPGGGLAGVGELHDNARRALATEALISVYHSYDRGRASESDVDSYLAFAVETYPKAEELPAWRALRRRQRVGDRLAPVVPTFAASVVWRRLLYGQRQRRWQRTGV